jgi:hypothetical protein
MINTKTYHKINNSRELEKLEKRVTTFFNKFIVLRDMIIFNDKIVAQCISCQRWYDVSLYSDKSLMNTKHLHCGHYYKSDRYASVRFDERNCNLQCYNCNRMLSGNEANYVINLIKKIGKDEFNELSIDRNRIKKFNYLELEELRDTYKAKCKIEAKRLGIKL